jgi:hypothetical protein
MSDNSHHVTDDEIQELARQFPALHQPSDCLAAVRRIGGMFATIISGRERVERGGFFIAPGASGSDGASATAPHRSPPGPGRRSGVPKAYTLQQANEIASELRALPAIEDSRRGLNKQQVVRRLAAEIATVQARGYTIDQVAEHLVALGFEISAPTLKSYLQRAKAARRRRMGARGTSRDGSCSAAPVRVSTAGPPAAALPSSPPADVPPIAFRSWADVFHRPEDPESVDIDIDIDLDFSSAPTTTKGELP